MSSNNISEQLFQAIDIITSKRLSELKFDKTVIAQITDASNASKGEYVVFDGATSFTVYSKDTTFKERDSVYISVPNGDFSSQKHISGKYIEGDNPNYAYELPTDKYVDITGDLCDEKESFSLVANDPTIKEILVWESNLSPSYSKGFDRLAIRADFSSWLKSFLVNGGNYGLRLDMVTHIPGSIGNPDKEKFYSFYLDSQDMYGNPYQYETFYPQENVFDISKVEGNVKRARVSFYQKGNFVNKNKDLISFSKDLPNIFVKNIYVGLGYNIEQFKEDHVYLYTLNSQKYNYKKSTESNRKALRVRWVHIDEDKKVSSVDSEKEIVENSIVHWYKYKLDTDKSDDSIAGANWEEILEARNKLELVINPDVNEVSQIYKVIIESPSEEYLTSILDSGDFLEWKNEISILENNYSNMNETSEEAQKTLKEIESLKTSLSGKVSGVLGQRKFYQSENLVFSSEVPVVDRMTADLVTSLKIDVDKDGFKGNYLIYDEGNELHNRVEATKMRDLVVSFDSIITGDPGFDDAQEIVWKIPIANTMIHYPEEGKEYTLGDGRTSCWTDEDENYCFIKRTLAVTSSDIGSHSGSVSIGQTSKLQSVQKFRIKDYYQEGASKNTIFCYVTRNNLSYSASATLNFGPMGNSGTDYTFRMSFSDNEIGLKRGAPSYYQININLFDNNNSPVKNFAKEGIELSWYSGGNNKGIKIYILEDDIGNFTPINLPYTLKYDNEYEVPRIYMKWDSSNTTPLLKNLILQAKVRSSRESQEKVLENVVLTTHLIIPTYSLAYGEITGYSGTSKISYNSAGVRPRYAKENYRIYFKSSEDLDIDWRIESPDPSSSYYPKFAARGDKRLIVPSVYMSGLDSEISAVASVGGDDLFACPIMMYQNKYTSAMLNTWDGKLTIDEKNGTILSTMIGAGKKENDNSYSGIIMGDAKDTVSDITMLGLYGFNHGIQSFGWKIDGTGFIGKKGRGQILFDGNKGVIKSGSYSEGSHGMEIDLDGRDSTSASLKAYGQGGKFELDTRGGQTPILSIKSPRNISLMEVGEREYYLQSDDEARSFKIDLKNGSITANKFDIFSANYGFDGKYRYIRIKSDSFIPLVIGGVNNWNQSHLGNFSVNYAGQVLLDTGPTGTKYFRYSENGINYSGETFRGGIYSKSGGAYQELNFEAKETSLYMVDKGNYLFRISEDGAGIESPDNPSINTPKEFDIISWSGDIEKIFEAKPSVNHGDAFSLTSFGLRTKEMIYGQNFISSMNAKNYITSNGFMRILNDKFKFVINETGIYLGPLGENNKFKSPLVAIQENQFVAKSYDGFTSNWLKLTNDEALINAPTIRIDTGDDSKYPNRTNEILIASSNIFVKKSVSGGSRSVDVNIFSGSSRLKTITFKSTGGIDEICFTDNPTIRFSGGLSGISGSIVSKTITFHHYYHISIPSKPPAGYRPPQDYYTVETEGDVLQVHKGIIVGKSSLPRDFYSSRQR